MSRKQKAVIIFIVLSLLLLSLACQNDGGNSTTAQTSTQSCFDRAYNECRTVTDDLDRCVEFGKMTCGD